MHFPLSRKRIFVAGHRGMVGSAIVRRLKLEECEILTAQRHELDLMDQIATRSWLADKKPDAIVLAAAKVGGILANESFPADFLYNNMIIAANVIEGAHKADIDRLLFLGSSCIYPKFAKQPIEEEAMLTGPLEPTNQWYAIAKIAGVKLCQAFRKQHGRDYISAMPTNLYGPGDNYDIQTSHVLPALVRKAHMARAFGGQSITIWGTGEPRREFLHADDCADAIVFLLQNYSDDSPVNVGSGQDIAIKDLARLVCDVVGFEGSIELDTSMADGTPRKLLDSEKLFSFGWRPKIDLREGLKQTYSDFLELSPEIVGDVTYFIR